MDDIREGATVVWRGPETLSETPGMRGTVVKVGRTRFDCGLSEEITIWMRWDARHVGGQVYGAGHIEWLEAQDA
jgi:hypothetical protein